MRGNEGKQRMSNTIVLVPQCNECLDSWQAPTQKDFH
jgi:hypothetical protein